MPAAVVLAVSIMAATNTLYITGHNFLSVVHGIQAIHRHTTKPVYQHVLKPVAKAITNGDSQ